MRLRTKFAIVLIAAALVLSGVVYFGLETSEASTIAEKQATVDDTAGLTADQIDASLRRQTNYIGFYASTPAARDFDNASAFLDAFLTSPRFYAAELVDANGTVVEFKGDVTTTTIEQTVGADHSSKPYVEYPLETGETFVSRPNRVDGTGELVLILSAPIFENDEIIGVLVAAYPLNEATLFSVIKPLETPNQAVTILGTEQLIRGPHQSFESTITGTATVERTGWQVVVNHNRAPLNTRLQQMAMIQFASLIIVFSVIVSLAVVEYEILLKQTNSLLVAFDAFRRGEYDYDLSLGGGEEWTEIADRFSLVGESLAEREAALRESEQRLSVLNRVLRHNLRNDMTVVLNYAKRIADETVSDARRADAEHIITKANDLVALGDGARRVENAMSTDETKELDLVAVTAQAVSAVRRKNPAASFSMSLPDEPRQVTVHPAFKQAVVSLVDNAVRHHDREDIAVGVFLEERDDVLRLDVTDTGPGIPEMESEVLSGGEETPLEHGSGLGLWLSQWVVEKSGGALSFSENQPRGTVVTITIPRD